MLLVMWGVETADQTSTCLDPLAIDQVATAPGHGPWPLPDVTELMFHEDCASL